MSGWLNFELLEMKILLPQKVHHYQSICATKYINIYQKKKNTFVKMETLFGFGSFLKRNFDVISRSESFH